MADASASLPDLVISETPDRIDFSIAGMKHYATVDGVVFHFGDVDENGTPVESAATLQDLVDAMDGVREFERQWLQPAGDSNGTQPTPPVIGKVVRMWNEKALIVTIAGHRMEYYYKDADPMGGIPIAGGWLTCFDNNAACVSNTPQQFADLCDYVVKWAAPLGVTPTVDDS